MSPWGAPLESILGDYSLRVSDPLLSRFVELAMGATSVAEYPAPLSLPTVWECQGKESPMPFPQWKMPARTELKIEPKQIIDKPCRGGFLTRVEVRSRASRWERRLSQGPPLFCGCLSSLVRVVHLVWW